MRYAIWYHLYNLKNVKNTNGGLLILVKLQASACNFSKINTPPWVFFTFFKLYKLYQIVQRITHCAITVKIYAKLQERFNGKRRLLIAKPYNRNHWFSNRSLFELCNIFSFLFLKLISWKMHNTMEVALKLETFSVVYSLNYSPRFAHYCGPGSNFKRMKVDRSFQITENH